MRERAPGGQSPATRQCDIRCGECGDVARHAHGYLRGIRKGIFDGIDPNREQRAIWDCAKRLCAECRIYRPGHNEAISGHIALQWRVGPLAVHRFYVLLGPRAHSRKVEVGVSRHERIVGPVDGGDAHRAALLTLILLEALAELVALCVRMDSEHVGPVHEGAVFQSSHAKDEAEHSPRVVEGTGADAAEFLSHE